MEFAQVVSVENMRKSDAKTIAEHTPRQSLCTEPQRGFLNRQNLSVRLPWFAERGITAATVMRSPAFCAKTALLRQFSE